MSMHSKVQNLPANGGAGSGSLAGELRNRKASKVLPQNVMAGSGEGTNELIFRASEADKRDFCSPVKKLQDSKKPNNTRTPSKASGISGSGVFTDAGLGLYVTLVGLVIISIFLVLFIFVPLKIRAERGDAVAQYEYGMATLGLAPFTRDVDVAASTKQKLAAKDLAGAEQLLTTTDEAEGAKWLHSAAKQGHAEAQFILAQLYADGRGMARNVQLAAHWLRQASKRGHVEAQHRLAKALQQGNGVPTDAAEAAYWFETAAGKGHGPSCMALAECYETGNGVKVDNEEVFKRYKKAADGGLAAAKVAVAARYAHGVGTAKHEPAAHLLLEEAAKLRDATAHYLLGQLAYHRKLTGNVPDKGVAFQYYMQAAERGHAWAQSAVGYMYSRGEVGKEGKDRRSAKAWWEKAAAQGLGEAKDNLQCGTLLFPIWCYKRASDLWM
eukprot:jgi/Mesen1/7707/ME000405S06991